MLIIAHRGLIEGPNETLQNTPDQIETALKAGFDVELDLWLRGDSWYLGHDDPDHLVSWDFINQDRLWIHCKNLQAFFALKSNGGIHNFFWHESDAVVLTSQGYVWTYFGKPETKSQYSICVMPEITYGLDHMSDTVRSQSWYGVCTDWPTII
jgi:hypothetical protein